MKIDLLAQKLIQNNGLSEVMARRDARALIEKEDWLNGDYAVVILENQDETPTNNNSVSSNSSDKSFMNMLYYKRRDNTWERDVTVSPDIFTDKTKFFCDLNTNCFQIGKSMSNK